MDCSNTASSYTTTMLAGVVGRRRHDTRKKVANEWHLTTRAALVLRLWVFISCVTWQIREASLTFIILCSKQFHIYHTSPNPIQPSPASAPHPTAVANNCSSSSCQTDRTNFAAYRFLISSFRARVNFVIIFFTTCDLRGS